MAEAGRSTRPTRRRSSPTSGPPGRARRPGPRRARRTPGPNFLRRHEPVEAQRFGGPAATARTTGAESARVVAHSSPNGHVLRHDPAFRRRVRAIHALGPRPTGELIAHIVERVPEARGPALELLDRYAGMNPWLLEAGGGRDWLERSEER